MAESDHPELTFSVQCLQKMRGGPSPAKPYEGSPPLGQGFVKCEICGETNSVTRDQCGVCRRMIVRMVSSGPVPMASQALPIRRKRELSGDAVSDSLTKSELPVKKRSKKDKAPLDELAAVGSALQKRARDHELNATGAFTATSNVTVVAPTTVPAVVAPPRPLTPRKRVQSGQATVGKDGVKRYTCTECGKVFKEQREFREHAAQHKWGPHEAIKAEDGSTKFRCLVEDKVVPDRKVLRKHMMTHRPKKFVCEHPGCNKRFYERAKLKRHHLVHTGEKPFICQICQKPFGYKANLKTHMRTHTGDKPFACTVPGCDRRFAQASNRNAHVLTHQRPSASASSGSSTSRNAVSSSRSAAFSSTATKTSMSLTKTVAPARSSSSRKTSSGTSRSNPTGSSNTSLAQTTRGSNKIKAKGYASSKGGEKPSEDGDKSSPANISKRTRAASLKAAEAETEKTKSSVRKTSRASRSNSAPRTAQKKAAKETHMFGEDLDMGAFQVPASAQLVNRGAAYRFRHSPVDVAGVDTDASFIGLDQSPDTIAQQLNLLLSGGVGYNSTQLNEISPPLPPLHLRGKSPMDSVTSAGSNDSSSATDAVGGRLDAPRSASAGLGIGLVPAFGSLPPSALEPSGIISPPVVGGMNSSIVGSSGGSSTSSGQSDGRRSSGGSLVDVKWGNMSLNDSDEINMVAAAAASAALHIAARHGSSVAVGSANSNHSGRLHCISPVFTPDTLSQLTNGTDCTLVGINTRQRVGSNGDLINTVGTPSPIAMASPGLLAAVEMPPPPPVRSL